MRSLHLISNTTYVVGIGILFPSAKIWHYENLFGEPSKCNETPRTDTYIKLFVEHCPAFCKISKWFAQEINAWPVAWWVLVLKHPSLYLLHLPRDFIIRPCDFIWMPLNIYMCGCLCGKYHSSYHVYQWIAMSWITNLFIGWYHSFYTHYLA